VPFLKVKAKAFVDQWLHIAAKDGSFRKIYAAWFD
jgi:cyclohexadienyl dehydratase